MLFPSQLACMAVLAACMVYNAFTCYRLLGWRRRRVGKSHDRNARLQRLAVSRKGPMSPEEKTWRTNQILTNRSWHASQGGTGKPLRYVELLGGPLDGDVFSIPKDDPDRAMGFKLWQINPNYAEGRKGVYRELVPNEEPVINGVWTCWHWDGEL